MGRPKKPKASKPDVKDVKNDEKKFIIKKVCEFEFKQIKK